MNVNRARRRSHFTPRKQVEHFDVLIVGAGISGIGSAYHLTKQLPGTSFVVLEEQATFGGTWWTHKYPGIRSDSDLHTFGYSFKPWIGPPIATAEEILAYMGEVIDENDLARHIRYKHQHQFGELVERDQSLDHRGGRQPTPAKRKRFTANFLWMCQGYYRHSEGYTPEWKGMDRFKGRIVHPQPWPDDLDRGQEDRRDRLRRDRGDADPEHRRQCAHVTMLQRSPTYFRTRPQRHRDSRRSCAGCRSTRTGSTRSCAARSCSSRTRSPSSACQRAGSR